jgi:hypothetical protein
MKLHVHNLAGSRRHGHTIVEVVIAAVILVVMFGAVGLATSTGNRAYQQGMGAAVVDTQAQRLLERIASEFLDADRSSITLLPAPPLGPTTIEFSRPAGFVGGAMVWGPRRQIVVRPSPTDPNDGIDNDNNGLVDECRVVLIPDVVGAPNVTQTLGSGVREYLEGETPNLADDNGNGLNDERGLCASFDATTGTLTLRLTIQRRGPDGNLITKTAQTAVLLRND